MNTQNNVDALNLSDAENVVMLKLDMKTAEGLETINKLFKSGLDSLTVMLTVSDATKCLTPSEPDHNEENRTLHAMSFDDDHQLQGISSHPIQNTASNHKIELDPEQPRICRTELTSRENQILEQIALGLSNKRIARKLDICEGTVKVHVKNLLRKLDVNTRYEAAIQYLNTGRSYAVA